MKKEKTRRNLEDGAFFAFFEYEGWTKNFKNLSKIDNLENFKIVQKKEYIPLRLTKMHWKTKINKKFFVTRKKLHFQKYGSIFSFYYAS